MPYPLHHRATYYKSRYTPWLGEHAPVDDWTRLVDNGADGGLQLTVDVAASSTGGAHQRPERGQSRRDGVQPRRDDQRELVTSSVEAARVQNRRTAAVRHREFDAVVVGSLGVLALRPRAVPVSLSYPHAHTASMQTIS